MFWSTYISVAVPLVLAFYLLICSTQVLLPKDLDIHQNVLVISILALLIPLLAFVAKTAIVPSLSLPQDPPSGAVRLLFVPFLEEVFKFSILVIAARMGGLDKVLHHAMNVALVLLCPVVVLALFHYAPNKIELYRKFYDYLAIWDDCRRAPLLPSKVKHRDSVESFGLLGFDEPQVGNGPSFNLDSFSKKKALTLSKLMPIMSSLLSYLSVMDRLYSVLPKNTLHLASDNESVEYSDNPYEELFNQDLGDQTVDLVDPNSSFESAVTDPGPQSCSMLRSSSSTSQLPNLSHTSTISASLKSLRRGFFGWFHWLVPFSLGRKRKPKSFYRRLQRVQIKQRFSTFSLNNETSSLLPSEKPPLYNTIDLEAQLFTPTYARQYNSHDFYEFAKFSNANYDEWVSPQNQVDPVFRNFGVTIEQFSIFYFFAYMAELVLAQFVSTMTLALPFYASLSTGALVAVFTGMFVSHLFCINFLKYQSEMSYKANIFVALAVRVVALTGLAAFYVYM